MVDISCCPPGFEEKYLQSNSDVREAVINGMFSSGWEHYLLFGFREHRSGAPSPNVQQTVQHVFGDSSKPLPPSALCKRVHGSEDLSDFERAGKIITLNIHSVMGSANLPAGRFLDFGCGCGRVVRYLYKLHPESRFYGTDIDEEAITWCRTNLSEVGKFFTNKHWPPLPFEDSAFDFIYSVSVFTHLPEAMQFAWLDELRRVIKPNGYLILTIHGTYALQQAPVEVTEQLREEGFYYSVGWMTAGLPSFYQTAFHTEDYIRNRWSRFFEITKIMPRAINGHQDLVLLRSRAA